jgi:hypothetical protein
MTKKRTPAAERRQETGTPWLAPPPAVPNNWPDTGSFPTRKGADVVRWACEETMTSSPSTKGQVGRRSDAAVNGPEDDDPDWLSIEWQQVEDDVRRLRQRIFTVSREGDLAKVRNLQKLMLRSRANALLSVRRVTERNAGRKTAGIDGSTVVTASGKAFLAGWVQRLRKLPFREPDEELLTKAFTSSHSSAEVYRLEAIETVFGAIHRGNADLEPWCGAGGFLRRGTCRRPG